VTKLKLAIWPYGILDFSCPSRSSWSIVCQDHSLLIGLQSACCFSRYYANKTENLDRRIKEHASLSWSKHIMNPHTWTEAHMNNKIDVTGVYTHSGWLDFPQRVHGLSSPSSISVFSAHFSAKAQNNFIKQCCKHVIDLLSLPMFSSHRIPWKGSA